MATPVLGDGDFLGGFCAVCGRQVLTHVQLDGAGAEVRLCLHCDTPLADLNPIAGADLGEAGYALIEARTCGNGGGCGSGGCGMRHGV